VPLVFLLLGLGADANFADPVELNGITCLFGENMAVLVLHQPAQTRPVSFVLSEGGSRFGIKLLAVDVVNHRVKIEQAGQMQYLRLCSAPDLAMNPAPDETLTAPGEARPLNPREQSQLDNFLNQDDEAHRIKSGNPAVNPVYYGAPYPGSGKSDSAPGNSASSSATGSGARAESGPSGSSDSPAVDAVTADPGSAGLGNSTGDSSTGSDSTTSTAEDYTKQYWYVVSEGIEQNRLATANQVMSGAMDPLPRTPLTPAQTPPALIGSDTFFPNHIPGFPYTGSVD
jgi:hypothetical protein